MGIIILVLVIIGIKSYFIRREFNDSLYGIVSGNSLKSTIYDKGNYGEYLTFLQLEKLEGNNKVLCNLYIPKQDGSTTEIDLIMINKSGIYVFESKNYSGWIFGDEKNKNWTQTFKGGKKNHFFNPIWQNKSHISALASVISDIDNTCFYSYIIFSERCTLKSILATSSRTFILKRNELLSRLRMELSINYEILSEEKINKIYYDLVRYCRVNEAVKEEHIKSIKVRRV